MSAPAIIAANVAKNAACDAQTALAANGTLEVRDSDDVLLMEFPLGATPWDPAVAGVAALSALILSSPAAASGNMSYYNVLSSGSAQLWRGSIGLSGTNIIVASLAVVATTVYSLASLNHSAH